MSKLHAHRLAILAGVLVVAGCGSNSKPAGPAPGSGGPTAAGTDGGSAQALTINIATPPQSLDPGNQCNISDGIAGNLYSRLVRFGSKPGPEGTTQTDQSKLVPDLATKWEVSPDGRVYTFTLRTDAKFASGRPVDAAAVKYTFDRIQKMGVCSAFDVNTADTGNVRSVEAVDPTTLRITMRHANSSLIKSWATPGLGIVDPSVVKANGGIVAGKPNEYLATHAAGSGPYRIDSYEPNQRLVLAANPDYYGPAPKSRRVVVNFVSADSTLLLQARDGTADVTLGLSKQAVKNLGSDKRVRVLRTPSTNTEQVVLNWDKTPFDNLLVRQAVSAAVPYQDLVEKAAFGFARSFYGPILPTMPFYDAGLSAPLTFDLARAKQLMQRAGVHTPVKATLIVDEGNAIHEQIATLLQDTWKQIGIDLSIRKLDQAAYTDALFGNKAQAALRRDGPFVNDPDYYLGYDLQCSIDGAENTGNICIKAADQQLLRARRALQAPAKQAAYDDVTRQWRAQAPKVFLYLDEDTPVLSTRVSAFQYDALLDSIAQLARGG